MHDAKWSLMTGKARHPKPGLWMVPLVPEAEQGTMTPEDPQEGVIHQAHHIHQSSTKTKTAQFYHQSLFSPPKVTLHKAINNEQLDTFPGLVPVLLKHLPPSTATANGRMHKNCKGLRSTRGTTQNVMDARLDIADMNPPQQVCAAHEHNVVGYAALADTMTKNPTEYVS